MKALNIGSIFHGRYRIDAFLGEGGSGSVYRAYQLDAKRNVAIKVLNFGKDLELNERERFLRECKMLSKLQHPNVVTFYNAAINEELRLYSVCEFVRGKTLARMIGEEKPMNWKIVCILGMQIAAAMSSAHSLGIVHRDLKPANIMLTNHEGAECPEAKILDFGLARSSADSQSLTNTGTLIGSVHYMSPEQCEGKVVDSISDVYSLGCVLYEMLTKEKLFDSETAIGVLHQHVHTPIDDSMLRLRSLGIPERLVFLIADCLEKNPKARLNSMQALHDRLSKIAEQNVDERLGGNRPSQNKILVSSLIIAILVGALTTLVAIPGLIGSRGKKPDHNIVVTEITRTHRIYYHQISFSIPNDWSLQDKSDGTIGYSVPGTSSWSKLTIYYWPHENLEQSMKLLKLSLSNKSGQLTSPISKQLSISKAIEMSFEYADWNRNTRLSLVDRYDSIDHSGAGEANKYMRHQQIILVPIESNFYVFTMDVPKTLVNDKGTQQVEDILASIKPSHPS